jgi:hypothetical protein
LLHSLCSLHTPARLMQSDVISLPAPEIYTVRYHSIEEHGGPGGKTPLMLGGGEHPISR